MQAPLLTLPLPTDGLGLTTDATILNEGGWSGLIQSAAAVLSELEDGTIAWFCPLSTGGESEDASALVGLIFTPAPQAYQWDALPMISAGVQPLPDMAFPALVRSQGHVHRVWLDDADGPVCLYLHQDSPESEVENLAVQSIEELHESEHANLPALRLDFEDIDLGPCTTLSGDNPADLNPDEMHIERLKIAFVWQFAYMVVSADDNVDESEARFMQQLFPTPLLQSLDLVDELGEFKEPAFTLAKTEALQVLPGALSIPDRVEILRTLQKAAWADGVLLPQETRVFRMARQLLEVPRDALD